MGFGTIVEHLPLAERPLPVKYVLPSPAFPSRSRKRPRTSDTLSPKSNTSTPRATPTAVTSNRAGSTGASSSKRDRKKQKVTTAPAATMFQGDGALCDSDDDDSDAHTTSAAAQSIFQQSSTRRYVSHTTAAPLKRMAQLDGPSNDSDSGSSDLASSDNDDDEPQSQSGDNAPSDDDSELLSTASSSSSGSESGHDDDERNSERSSERSVALNNTIATSSSSSSSSSSSGSESDAKPHATTASRNADAAAKKKRPKPAHARVSTSNGTAAAAPSSQRRHSEIRLRRSRRSKPKATSTNPIVNELMRTDDNFLIEPTGTDDELNLLECGFRYPASYKRLRVWLPEITDWCLDYSDGDPTLWVITPHAWYKVAGPLSGLLPHAHYRKTFTHVRMLFESSYLVAYVLKEWLPLNKKVAYRATLEQICELSLKSRYRVVRCVDFSFLSVSLSIAYSLFHYHSFVCYRLSRLGGSSWRTTTLF